MRRAVGLLLLAGALTWQGGARAQPTVSDPMLAPVAPPKRVIASWSAALSLAQSRSTTLRSAYDAVAYAEGQTRATLAALLPSAQFTGTGTLQFITNTSSQVVAVDASRNPVFRAFTSPTPVSAQGLAQAVQPLLAIESFYALGTAGRAEDAASLAVEDTKRVLATGLATAIVGVVTAERVAELNRVGLRQALERLELTRRRQTLGAGSGLDVARVRADVEAARAALVLGDESLRQSRETLGLAVGLPQQVGVQPSMNLDEMAADAIRSCPAHDLEDRGDLASARAQADVAARGVTDVYLQFLPTVSLQSNLSTTTVDTGATPPTLWNVQAVLNVPIWDGGARYGLLRERRASEDQAEQTVTGLRRTAVVQVEQARRAVEVAEESVRVLTSARDVAVQIDQLAQEEYRVGKGTSLDLVVAAAARRQAEINLAVQQFGLVLARIAAVLVRARCSW